VAALVTVAVLCELSLSPATTSLRVEPCALIMAEESDEYLAVLKASYDYEPQSDEEIAIKEDQLLFLLHKTDDEYGSKLYR
jgi:hypothetical protein